MYHRSLLALYWLRINNIFHILQAYQLSLCPCCMDQGLVKLADFGVAAKLGLL
jgi:hypothetical protein